MSPPSPASAAAALRGPSPAPAAPADPYLLRPEDVAEPPRTIGQALGRVGPGMILAASIVGSGELIATTTLGAQAGYAALWVVLLSCLLKPVVQAELGRYTIATGETGLEALNRVPGPRAGVNWVVWAWAAMVLITLLQIGAMFGGVSQVMNILVPAVPVAAWVVAFLVLSLVLLLGGAYERVERLAMVKVALFTLLTVLAAVVLSRMPGHFSWAGVASGLTLGLPSQGLATAIAVFGITGVGASELFMYPYWCVEKGYARFAGRRDGGPDWRRRAGGWIRVMHVDIACSLVVYTLATVAFYLLGAGILNGMGLVPASRDMIPVLSNIYTRTLGPWALVPFYVGAVATLYGTIFAATAAQSRMMADMARMLGAFERGDYRARVVWRRRFVVLLTVVPVVLYGLLEAPVKMVVAGGIAQSLLLPVLGGAALYLRHRHLPPEVAPSAWTTGGLWVATGLIFTVMLYYVVLMVR
jgi:Mn2+/Fe2+ NRAMP family transporter